MLGRLGTRYKKDQPGTLRKTSEEALLNMMKIAIASDKWGTGESERDCERK
jgi:hypothetical protein